MPRLLVPSDITILENERSIGYRSPSLMERLGLCSMPPMWHLNYSKNDKHAMRKLLTKQYDKSSSDPVIAILRKRQESIRKQAVAQNGVLFGTVGGTGSVWYSMRHYDYKSKLIVLPFAAYGGSWLGRTIFDGLVGRWSEYKRDQALGRLPAKTYYTGA